MAAMPVQMPALALMVGNAVAGVEFQAAGDEHGASRKSGGDLSEAGLYNGPMLTIADHRRDSAGLTPSIPSYRAGRAASIGINLNVNNACNWPVPIARSRA